MHRLIGEWKAVWWLLKAIAWNFADAMTYPWKIFKSYRVVRPFEKCSICGEWFQGQIIFALEGLCERCDAQLKGEQFASFDDAVSDDVPF